jgi:tetratricopeptide (TPR) repeat protein
VKRARAQRALAALAAILGAGSCALFGGSGPEYEASSGPCDALPGGELERVAEARLLIEDGLPAEARGVLLEVAERRPENVPLAILLQEVELGLAGPQGASTVAAEAALRSAAHPTLVTRLLAARLEPDPSLAREQIEAALAIDPRSAWAHYAIAHLEARSGNWVGAGRWLQRALERDPGLLPARRLEAAFLARDGKRPEAISALLHWLEVTEGNALVDPSERFLAALDLAQRRLRAGDEGRARSVLVGLGEGPAGCRARELVILAAVEHARGQMEDALRAARRAEAADPSEPLAVVQLAELYETQGDLERAKDKWERLLEIASETGDLKGLLLSMRARVALERVDAAAWSPGRAGALVREPAGTSE